MDRQYLNKES